MAKINCPACNEEEVRAETFVEEIEEKIFFILTLNRQKFQRVVCKRCHAQMDSSIALEEFAALAPAETTFYLKHDPGFIPKFLAVLALLLSLLPGVGTVLAIVAFMANYQHRIWSRTLSIIAFAVSLVPFLALGGTMLCIYVSRMK